MGANFIEATPVIVNSEFLYGVNRHLTSLTRTFGDQESSARRLLRASRDAVGTAETNWTGPRSTKVIGSARDYLDVVDDYPNALSSAVVTLARWASAALQTADELAALESRRNCVMMTPETSRRGCRRSPRVASPPTLACSTRSTPSASRGPAHVSPSVPSSTAAIGAITAANAATAIKTDHEQAEQLLNELAVSNLHGPSEVGEWWNGLTDGQRLTLLSTFPGPLSRLDGIPAKARAIAARTQSIEELMRLEAAEADGTLTPQPQRRLAHLRATLGGDGEETGRSADPDVVHFLPGSLPINGPRRSSPD